MHDAPPRDPATEPAIHDGTVTWKEAQDVTGWGALSVHSLATGATEQVLTAPQPGAALPSAGREAGRAPVWPGTVGASAFGTDDDRKKFEERAACVVDQFNKYEVQPGLFIDGKPMYESDDINAWLQENFGR